MNTFVLQKSYTQCAHSEVKLVTDEQCAGCALRSPLLWFIRALPSKLAASKTPWPKLL